LLSTDNVLNNPSCFSSCGDDKIVFDTKEEISEPTPEFNKACEYNAILIDDLRMSTWCYFHW